MTPRLGTAPASESQFYKSESNETRVEKERPICLWGAALDTGNLGVSALGIATLYGLSNHLEHHPFTVFDYARGTNNLHQTIGGRTLVLTRCGAFHTRRIYYPESLWNIRVCARLGALANPAAHAMRSARAVLDISGGDSFTDLYGPWRFRAVTLPKIIALELRKPLVLLPQTYGPFRESSSRKIAQSIVQRSMMAWARDARSFDVLKELLGDTFDPARHRVGVDVAFGLPASRPMEEVLAPLQDWLESDDTPLVGFNVSGLLLNQLEKATVQYELRANYRELVLAFLRRLLRDSNARVLLVPHVVTPPGHYESDISACESIAMELSSESDHRLAVAPIMNDPCKVKWIVARCGWFCGTRMHSTIAALSSGVPTAAISYSPKTLGVFETCDQGAHVADPRTLDTVGMSDQLWASWCARDEVRQSLMVALPSVLSKARQQMDEIVSIVRSGGDRRESVLPR